ncbi:MAG: ribosome-binding factor A [Candidatus Taylorbacteria bacterium]|nr:ribosome-binding factor A [Candidatus Taylorbacteria bacterium]
MPATRDDKLRELIRELAGEYFARESNHQSLITITNVEIVNKGSKARLLITVLPAEQEDTALSFMHRQLTELRQYVMERARLMRVPFFEVAIDRGEKNRQRLDDIEKTM